MKSKVKIITALLLTAVLCLCFASCVNNTSVKSNSNHESSAEQTTPSSFLTQEEEETTEASNEKEKSTAKEETADSTKVTTEQNKSEKTTVQSTAKPTTTAKSTTSKKEITCTLTIECKAILSNMNDLKPGHEKYVPSSGYILNGYTCAVNSGDTVFDILEKACDDNSIILNSRSSGYGVYVVGINNIDEFDYGSQSGWKYKVNGVDANRSSGYYKLTGGENIVFYYTVTG